MKYCDNCGKPSMDNAEYCGYCGRKFETGSGKRKSSMVWSKVLIGAVVLAAIVITSAVLFARRGKTPIVRNASDAAAYLKTLGEDLGYKNAFSELTEKGTTEIDGDTYYRFQQNYLGIPVYGRTAIYVTDADGKETATIGNLADVDENIFLTPVVTEGQIEKIVRTYIANELSHTDIAYFKLYEVSLCIYNLGTSIENHLAYVTQAALCDGMADYLYEIILDATDGQIVHYKELFAGETAIGYTASDTEHKNGFPIEKYKENYYVLEDVKRGLYVQTLHGHASSHKEADGTIVFHLFDGTSDAIVSDDIIFGNGEESALGYEDAAHLLMNVIPIYDYYKSFGFETANGKVHLFYDDGFSSGRNARGGRNEDGSGGLITGSITGVNDIDALAHEYTHIVSSTLVDWAHTSMQNDALIEAISDIFGELIEMKILNLTEPDWVMLGDNISDIVNRGLADPNKTGYAAKLSDPNESGHPDSYGYSTVISHAAYLMWNGIDGNDSKALSTEELAKLWYRAMLMMPSDCNFTECRALVEIAAESMNLSDAKKQCVRDAFDAVGIEGTSSYLAPCDYRVSPDSTISILDSEGNLFSGYTLRISNTTTDAAFIAISYASGVPYNSTVFVNSGEPYRLSLPEGHYLLTVSCQNYPETTYHININIDKTAPRKNIPVYTEYAPRIVVVLNGTEEASVPQPAPTRNLLTHASQYQDGKLIESTYLHYNEDGFLSEVERAFIRPDGSEGKSLNRFSCDSQGRMIKHESWYDDFTGEASEITIYTYGEDGLLLREDCKRWTGSLSWTTYEYEYDEHGTLRKTSQRDESGNLEAVHLYDAEGKNSQSTIWLPDGSSETYKDDSYTEEVEEYPPVTVSWIISENFTSVELRDSAKKTMLDFPIPHSDLIFDEDGLLTETKAQGMGIKYDYKFYYNGEIPEEALTFVLPTAETEPPKGKGLTYPISEEDCYVIYKNYFGIDMWPEDENDGFVDVEQYGEGSEEHLAFFLYLYNPYSEEYTWRNGFFVYVNTGKCESEIPKVTFQAEDYYY